MTLTRNITKNQEVPAVTIAGVAPFSTADWPGNLCATIFLQGCPWRCPYCHNGEMQSGNCDQSPYTPQEVLHFIENRCGLLDGIVLSGGEPLMQAGSLDLAKRIVEKGLSLGLHTGGYRPEMLRELLNYTSWVGFDYKTLFSQYDAVVGAGAAWGALAAESLNILLQSDCSFEVRTTIDAHHFTLELLSACEEELTRHGIDSWVLQACHSATKEGALTNDAPSLNLITTYLARNPHSIARMRTA